MPKSNLLILLLLCSCAAKPAPAPTTEAAPAPSAPRRELPSLAEEKSRPPASTTPSVQSAAGSRQLPSLADEKARQKGAPIPLPDAPPAGISEAARSYPEWWLTSPQLVDGRMAACGEAEGVSFVGARQLALDQAVAALRTKLAKDPADLSTDRVTSIQSGGMFKVRVRVSASVP